MPEPDGRAPDSIELVHERIRSLSESARDIRESFRDLETRVRRLETEEMEALRQQVCRLESKASSFESAHDEHKERWNMALNFAVQLMWVVTAAFVLTKLGLNMGPT